jgi:RNA polymerase sigma-70 factor (ECF subfamily)
MTPSTFVEDELAAHRGELLVYACRLSGDRDEAEDVVQAAFLKALQSARSGVEARNPRAWLYRIVHNEALTFRRRSRREAAALVGLPKAAVPADPARERLLGKVEREIGLLAEPYRSALRLRYLQHLKVEDVADVLQLSVGTVKSQLARGLRLLTDRMGDAMEGEEA